jgi:hypothetical protein
MAKNQKKRLKENMISLLWDRDRLSINKKTSEFLFNANIAYVRIITCNNRCALHFTKTKAIKSVNVAYSEYANGGIRAQVYVSGFTKEILTKLGKPNECWYVTYKQVGELDENGLMLALYPMQNMAKIDEKELFQETKMNERNEIPQGMTQEEYGHVLALIKAGYKITVERPAVKLIG